MFQPEGGMCSSQERKETPCEGMALPGLVETQCWNRGEQKIVF